MADAAAAAQHVEKLLSELYDRIKSDLRAMSHRIDLLSREVELLVTNLRDIEARNATALHRPAYVGY